MESIHAVFQPIQVGPFRVRNRLEVSPAEPMLCTKEGLVTSEFVAYMEQFAKAGIGIVTVGDSSVTQAYAETNHYALNLSDRFVVQGLVRVSEAIHRWNAIASIELNLRDDRLPADFSHDEVIGIQDAFANAALLCKKGGFDMVMLHFGHGHTASSFYSPYMNRRTDEYGCQTFENRIRFASELIDKVRKVIGPEMAIEIRMSGDELYPEGVHVEEGLAFVRAIQDKIDLLHVSAGSMYDPRTMGTVIQNTYMPRPASIHIARQYKAAGLRIPVVSVGSHDMISAEKAIAGGDCDMVAMIRSFLADPDQLRKAKAGKTDEIRPCIRCNSCTGGDPHGCPTPLRCTVNAAQGLQPLFTKIEPADPDKKVVIVGGGAAGMEAARRLSQRGIKPVLYEEKETLGGALLIAGANPIKADVRRYGEWSVRMTLRDENILVRTGTKVTRELIEKEKPDVLIIAVGSSPILPGVQGIDDKKVCFAQDIDTGDVEPGHRVVIVGAGLTGTETAVTLARNGHEVTVIDRLPLKELTGREKLLRAAQSMAVAAGVTFMEQQALDSVTESGLLVKDSEGNVKELLCDTIALALGVRPKQAAADELSGICEETYYIGDCHSHRGNITSAVREGFYAAMNI